MEKFNKEKQVYENIVYLPVTAQNNFEPELPKQKVDLIYLCFPNNPTGTVLTKEQLKKWVDYAKENNSIILYDAAYEAFITEKNIPHSIYEVEGAKDVAIEFKSYSKTAGFTGVRCAYLVIPKTVKGYTKTGEKIELNKLWNRRTCTKFNGVSYIVQRAAEATYSKEGKKEIKANIEYYLENAKIIREGLIKAGYEVYGGVNSPYIWLKVPGNMTSWEFFDKLLAEKKHSRNSRKRLWPSRRRLLQANRLWHKRKLNRGHKKNLGCFWGRRKKTSILNFGDNSFWQNFF